MSAIGELLADLTARFAAAGIDSARLDARLLAARVLGLDPLTLAMRNELVVDAQQKTAIEVLAARRLNREPMSHILGRRGFWTLDLTVTSDTLDPRPDTECLVQGVLDRLPDRSAALRIVDFGTGTGCILLALLSELPHARGLGVDRSAAALAVAVGNAKACGLDERAEFVVSDWAASVSGAFDVVVSNPPYIPDAEIDGLEPEVARFEPRGALAGGPDGLDCCRMLVPQAAALTVPGGLIGMEVGAGQAPDLADLYRAAGLKNISADRDLAGVERAVFAVR